jgi:hypothetical protein
VTQSRIHEGTSHESIEYRVQRRQRTRHIRRRRRDLLFDAMVAVVLTVVLMINAPGLGVVAILDVAIAMALLGWIIVEQSLNAVRRRRRPYHRAELR